MTFTEAKHMKRDQEVLPSSLLSSHVVHVYLKSMAIDLVTDNYGFLMSNIS